MTYERPHIIGDTILKVFEQTYPPEKLLIVDNSPSKDTELVIHNLSDSRLEYLHLGFNAGPAGSARIGLEKLYEQGYDWIYWGDDDDPPKFPDSLELILQVVDQRENIGIAGAVGGRFNWSTGMLQRLDDDELKGVVAVDFIAGGMVIIVNAAVVARGILPDERFFFGFEDLDFCINAKRAGFDIAINGELAYRNRKSSNRLKLEEQKDRYQGWKFKKSKATLWREYYSIRSFAFMMLHKNKRYTIFFILLLRVFYKMLIGFKVYGRAGFLNCKILFLAVKDAILKRMGRNDEIQRLVKS